ncbi:calcium/calmodulin-dependent protein kinase type 1-like [Babylonia areolata]|uniref:calcium/calmodulin-dependent protein kinase type 1-like n=1 Tax=Babylonia areolata TaxID=304850 RepID=UPI003FD28706
MAALEKLFQEDYEPTDRRKVVSHYILGKILGQGRSSLVRQAVDIRTGQRVAIKTMLKTAGIKGKRLEQQFRQETEILLRARHPNIVTLIEVIETTRNLYVVMEMVTGFTLRSVLNNRSIFTEEEAQLVVQQLCCALNHLHGMEIVHRDVKPENVMVSNNRRTHIKLIDLGLSSNATGGSTRGQCGSPLYMAPELLRGQSHGPAVDMWSVGVLLFELLMGHVPFEPERGSRQVAKNMTSVYGQIIRGVCRDVCGGVPASSDGADFLRKLLVVDDKQRMTSKETLAHAWLAR